jgi:predicted Zn-dependent protease
VRAADPAPVAKPDAGGVKIGNPSFIRKLISAEKVEQIGTLQYQQLTAKEAQFGRLLPPAHPQVVRLRQIAQDLLPHTAKFNDRAKAWKWEVNVLAQNQVNAFCMPGGKIAVFMGILDRLKLTDDEVAVVMGHEIAHALREHARERMAKQLATQGGAILVGVLTGSRLATDLAQGAGNLLGLKFSRDDETEADLIGMELAARAGYDPRAGVTLWQKMSAAAKGAPPQWLSTHPSSVTRIDTIKANLKDVLPLYEAAKKNRG